MEHLRYAGHVLSMHRCSSNPDSGPWRGAVVLAVSRGRGETEAQDGEGLALLVPQLVREGPWV